MNKFTYNSLNISLKIDEQISILEQITKKCCSNQVLGKMSKGKNKTSKPQPGIHFKIKNNIRTKNSLDDS